MLNLAGVPNKAYANQGAGPNPHFSMTPLYAQHVDWSPRSIQPHKLLRCSCDKFIEVISLTDEILKSSDVCIIIHELVVYLDG